MIRNLVKNVCLTYTEIRFQRAYSKAQGLTLQNVVIVNKTIIKIYIGQLHNYYELVSFGNSAESD